jgi:DNA-binding NarL/FixJ family response regulator
VNGDAIRVLIADDHAALRGGIRRSLEADGFEVCGEAADAGEAIALGEQLRPAVCLLDVHMPGGGIHAAQRIAALLPETIVVMLTVSRNDEDLFGALRAGAAGYLLKDTDPERLPHAIRGVVAGEAAMPRELVARVIDELRNPGDVRRRRLPGRRGATLTSREWEVLDLMSNGHTTAAMSARLGISAVTIRRHVSGILRKLEVRDREAAVRLVESAEL